MDPFPDHTTPSYSGSGPDLPPSSSRHFYFVVCSTCLDNDKTTLSSSCVKSKNTLFVWNTNVQEIRVCLLGYYAKAVGQLYSNSIELTHSSSVISLNTWDD